MKKFTNLSWKEQLLYYAYGKKKKEINYLVVNPNSKGITYAGIKEKKLIIKPRIIEKLDYKHGLNVEFLLDLNKIINNSLFAFESIQRDDSLVFVTKEKTSENNPIIFIVAKDKQADNFEVNEISSIYDKKNLQNLIDRSLEQGKKAYINPKKEKEFKNSGFNIDLNKEAKKNKWIKKDNKELGR